MEVGGFNGSFRLLWQAPDDEREWEDRCNGQPQSRYAGLGNAEHGAEHRPAEYPFYQRSAGHISTAGQPEPPGAVQVPVKAGMHLGDEGAQLPVHRRYINHDRVEHPFAERARMEQQSCKRGLSPDEGQPFVRSSKRLCSNVTSSKDAPQGRALQSQMPEPLAALPRKASAAAQPDARQLRPRTSPAGTPVQSPASDPKLCTPTTSAGPDADGLPPVPHILFLPVTRCVLAVGSTDQGVQYWHLSCGSKPFELFFNRWPFVLGAPNIYSQN